MRPPSQASQLPQGIGYARKKYGGHETAIASKLAPTGERVHPEALLFFGQKNPGLLMDAGT